MKSHRIPCALFAALAAALFVGTAFAQGTNVDRDFVDKAYQINQAEIALGRMAEAKGATQAVRSFGARMVRDHTKALLDLRKAAGQAQMTIPNTVEPPRSKLEQQLGAVSGTQFDDQYMNHMVAGHGAAIDAFTREIANGRSAPLRSYAERMLPVLESHESAAVRGNDTLRRGH